MERKNAVDSPAVWCCCSKQHGSYSALSMLATQGSADLSPHLPPLSAASSAGAGGAFFGRSFLRRGASADLGAAAGGRAPWLGLGSGRQRKQQQQQAKPVACSPGADAAPSDDDPSSEGHHRLPAGAFDGQLAPLGAAATSSFRPSRSAAAVSFVDAGPLLRPVSPLEQPALRVATGRPQSPFGLPPGDDWTLRCAAS